MNYEQAMEYIHAVQWAGHKPGLTRTRTLLAALGDPHKQLRFVHVAGTNGKGSTAAMMASCLQTAGYQMCIRDSPKTIIYSLNPADDAQIGTILGCFQNSEVPGKIQHGSAWWFNDHKIGMEEQMTRLASLGLLGNFVGMLTDSRSFLSYTRHDYFRRILCNIIGQWVEDGEYPNDEKALEKIVKGICFDNAKRYFNL